LAVRELHGANFGFVLFPLEMPLRAGHPPAARAYAFPLGPLNDFIDPPGLFRDDGPVLGPTVTEPSLRERVEAFGLDQAGVPLPFTSRLAREQGWTHAFAGRVVTEYKRFIVLAMEAGHPVSPSEPVDQAWHLHLVYTRSYWQDLCREVLGRELHHEPTTGGSAETDKFADWYARTLESYRNVFGEEPPPEIWPAPDRRFAESPQARWIDEATHWVLPKPKLKWLSPALRLISRKQPQSTP
jgi:hypothetical protein